MPDLLTVESVTKSFGRLVAVNDLSFNVHEGEVFGIAGPNGSGKSTLFNVLTKIPFGPDRGRILLRGRPIHRMPAYEICRRGIARTFQRETLFDSLTVEENVRLAVSYGRTYRPTASTDEKVQIAMDLVGLKDRHTQADTLSVFDKKRLMIASAIATEPDALLLDEPASGLTQPEITELISLVRLLNGRGMTIVLIEHVLPLLLSVSERLMVLNHGQLLTLGTPDTVVADERVIEAYLGRRAKEAHA